MGLVSDVIKDTFMFWKSYFSKIVQYQLIFLVFYLVGILLFVPLLFWIGISIIGVELLPFPVVLISIIAGVVVLIASYGAQIGGYSLIFYQLDKTGRFNLLEAVKKAFKKVHKILAVMILSGIVFAPVFVSILVGIFLTGMLGSISEIVYSMVIFIIVLIVGLIVGIYVTSRLSISIPILMIEERGCIESLKKSWAQTKDKILRILGASFVVGLIVSIVSSIVSFVVSLSLVLFLPYVSPVGSLVGNLISYLFFQPVTAFVPVVIYYNLRFTKK